MLIIGQNDPAHSKPMQLVFTYNNIMSALRCSALALRVNIKLSGGYADPS